MTKNRTCLECERTTYCPILAKWIELNGHPSVAFEFSCSEFKQPEILNEVKP